MSTSLAATIVLYVLLQTQPNGGVLVHGVFPTQQECLDSLTRVQSGVCTKFQSVSP